MLKGIHWMDNVSMEIARQDFHTVFFMETEEHKFEIGEPITLTWGLSQEESHYLGLGEVIAIKRCAIRDLEPRDLERNKYPFKSIKGCLQGLKTQYPKKSLDIDPSTQVDVITIRRNDYKLKPIVQYFKKKEKRNA